MKPTHEKGTESGGQNPWNQVAILDAIPAHIALLDAAGVILMVNESWKQFATANQLPGPAFGVGCNYLEVCERASGDRSKDAAAAARGLRRVLAGKAPDFTLEYPCHSPEAQRWFRLMVTPVSTEGVNGAVVMHIDITKRRLAEEALQESEERFRGTFDQAAVGLAHVSPEGRYMRVNDRLCQILGYTQDEMLRLALDDVTEPEDQDRSRQAHEALLGGQLSTYAAEKRYRRKNGKLVWINLAATLQRTPAGAPQYFIMVVEDISARKRTEHALRASEQRFASAFEHAAVGMALVSPEGRHLKANRQLCQMLGYTAEELVTRTFQDITHPDDLAADLEFVRQLLAGTIETYQLEKRYLHREGRLVWVLLSVSLVRDDAGRPLYFIAQIQNITERKLAENALRESNEKFRQLAENITDVFWIRSPDMQELHYISPAYERIWGRSQAIIQEAPEKWLEYILPEDRERVRRGFSELMHHAPSIDLEYRITRADGEIRWIRMRGFQVRDAAGRLVRLTGIATDITERKQLEQQFLRAQRMESIGTLAGGIAHDLNNLLAPIMMGVDLLKHFGVTPRSQPVIENIERSARRGADLVKQVLSFARGVEGSRVILQAGHILREIESIAENTFPKNIHLESRIAKDLWPVMADSTQLNQVVLNLCVNARDAMPEGGMLELAADNIEIDEQYAAMNHGVVAGRYVVVQVTDNGCGMPREVVDRIFEPFYTTKELGKGTGLGLSTVLGIIRSHGGFVNVYSEPGRGSVFKVYLPAQISESDAPVEAVPERLPRGRGERILVVDDEAAILDVTSQTLRSFGYEVVSAEDGAQAIGLYARMHESIAVVLTDMMMPVMDGPALINALRRINPGVRIIAASGLNAQGNATRAASAGVRHFLAKPYTIDALLILLRQVIEEKSSRPPM